MKRQHHVRVDENGKMVWIDHVRVKNAKEMQEAIAFLEEKGFENIQNLTAENYHFPILVVQYDYFYGTNTTCMACAATQGNKTLSFKEFQAFIEAKTEK